MLARLVEESCYSEINKINFYFKKAGMILLLKYCSIYRKKFKDMFFLFSIFLESRIKRLFVLMFILSLSFSLSVEKVKNHEAVDTTLQ